MELFCRLCAKIKNSFELKYSIDEVSVKLKDCCQSIEMHTDVDYPQSVCEACFLKLDDSWKLFKTIENAQDELRFMVSQKKENDSLQNNLGYCDDEFIKVEPLEINDNSQVTIHEPQIEVGSKLETMMINSQDILQEIGFDDFHSTDDSEPEEKSVQTYIKTSNPDNCKNFLALIPEKDRMKNGTINPVKIMELKLYDWSILKFKCWKCNNIFSECKMLKIHIKQEHPHIGFRWICPLCCDNRTYSREDHRRLRYHVISKHFSYLSYW